MINETVQNNNHQPYSKTRRSSGNEAPVTFPDKAPRDTLIDKSITEESKIITPGQRSGFATKTIPDK